MLIPVDRKAFELPPALDGAYGSVQIDGNLFP